MKVGGADGSVASFSPWQTAVECCGGGGYSHRVHNAAELDEQSESSLTLFKGDNHWRCQDTKNISLLALSLSAKDPQELGNNP